ncbi:ArsR family transcriptional regulator [Candidatus Woesearchaeota archaeon]|nr:ArsR family transcriptional regulator [Candidatus Woesearchaeota archaeon]
MTYRIVIRRIRKPQETTLNDELQWFGNSLGLFSERDKDRSCFRLFIELLKAAKQDRPLSSDELAWKLGLTRGTVVHHINKLMDNGMVVTLHKRYILREPNLKVLLEKMKKDFDRAYNELYAAADEMDRLLGE